MATIAWRQGTFLVQQSRVICNCDACARLPEKKREMSATHFEAHCGAGAAKKWKSSVRIVAGTIPEALAGTSYSRAAPGTRPCRLTSCHQSNMTLKTMHAATEGRARASLNHRHFYGTLDMSLCTPFERQHSLRPLRCAGGSNLSVGKWLITRGLEEPKEPKPKATPPGGSSGGGVAGAMASGGAAGGAVPHKGSAKGHAHVKKEGGFGGGGGGKQAKWEELLLVPSEAALAALADGPPKPRIGRPPKDRPKVFIAIESFILSTMTLLL